MKILIEQKETIKRTQEEIIKYTVQAYEAGEYPPSKTWIILFKQLEIQIKALRLQKKLKEEISFFI